MNFRTVSRRRFLGATTTFVAGLPFVSRGAARRGFEIGFVADAQYADIDSKGTRFYRHSIAKIEAAVEHFNRRDLACCVHLGDLIDREWRSFDEILRPLGRSRHSWHQLLGNHDFEVLDEFKAKVPERLGLTERHGKFVQGEFRFVMLDTNDVSTYAYASTSPARRAAEAELARLQAAGVRQAKPWNGGIGAAQLAWLERECTAARTAGQKVVILAHHPIWPDNDHNVWNAADVHAVIDRQPHVVAWINGHNHAGAFGERADVPCLTMKGMVETAETNAFATAQFLSDRVIITGHGREPSRELKFRPQH